MLKHLLAFSLATSALSGVLAQTVSAGDAHSFFVCNDFKSLRYCGGKPNNQVPAASNIPASFSLSLPVGVTVKAISAGGYHTLFLLSNGKVFSLGNNFYGQLGDGTNTDRTAPVEVKNITNAVSIGTGSANSYFVLANDSVKVCGNNGYGQLGINTIQTTKISSVANMVGMTNAAKADGGYAHAIILDKNGRVWGAGQASYGQFGDTAFSISIKPRLIETISDVKDISTSGYHTLFLKNDGTVWACGHNLYGQLGDSTNANRSLVKKVEGLSNVKAIAAGESHSLFLLQDGSVYACGINGFGQLGTDDYTDFNYPVKVQGLDNIVAIAAGYNHSFFVSADGNVKSFGVNSNGQLGLGSADTDVPAPQQISGLCSISTGITALNPAQELLNLYPVPLQDVLNFSTEKQGEFTVTVMDINGKILLNKTLFLQTDKPAQINTTEWSNGIYIVTVTDEKQHNIHRRIVKSQP